MTNGRLPGAVWRACGYWSRGPEFESHIGHRVSLKKKRKEKHKYFKMPQVNKAPTAELARGGMDPPTFSFSCWALSTDSARADKQTRSSLSELMLQGGRWTKYGKISGMERANCSLEREPGASLGPELRRWGCDKLWGFDKRSSWGSRGPLRGGGEDPLPRQDHSLGRRQKGAWSQLCVLRWGPRLPLPFVRGLRKGCVDGPGYSHGAVMGWGWALTAQTGGIPARSSLRKSPGQGDPLGAPLSTAHPVEMTEWPVTWQAGFQDKDSLTPSRPRLPHLL